MNDDCGVDTSALLSYWPFDDDGGKETTEGITGETVPIDYVFNDAQFKPDSEPHRPDAIVGTGLLFDGYSTWVEHETDLLADAADSWSIEAWIAPRSTPSRSIDRPAAIASKHDRSDRRGFEFGLAGGGRCTLGIGTGKDWYTVSTSDPLPTYEWSHVVGVFDGDNEEFSLFLDGTRVDLVSLPSTSSFAPAEVPLRIGRNNEEDRVAERFVRNSFDGVIDELRVYGQALNPTAVRTRFDADLERFEGEKPPANYDAIGHPARYDGDQHRPQYHPIPAEHWMNEPHAPLYYDGRYHLFYQHNPSGPYWGNIHWGHWVSDDMVHWHQLPPALSPGADGIDPDGIWSGGSTLDADGQPLLLYTAGDMSKTPDQSIATARPVDETDPDLVDWHKSDEAVIERPNGIGLRKNEFRDPFVWREDGTWYCLVGSGVEGGGGRALLYETSTLDAWEFRGSLYESDYDQFPELGHVWELPVLLPIGTDDDGTEKHAFLVSPVEGPADVEVYYWIGEWKPSSGRFVPDHDAPRLIDYGDFHFTGPHGFVDPQTGRSILFTITQDDRTPSAQYDAGWAHNGGLPLHLYLNDHGRLGIEPIDELSSLRTEQTVAVKDRSTAYVDSQLSTVRSDTIEIQATLESAGADRYGLKIRSDPDGPEETLVYYDETAGEIRVHREQSSSDPTTRAMCTRHSQLVHSGPVSDDGPIDLRIYIDRSMLEVYINEHRSITTRLYPTSEAATGVELYRDGEVAVEELSIWELDSAGNYGPT